MLKSMKKDGNKGFTLVELIVVLVILAILAAILVPALLGYIDRARSQQIVLNARSCYTAAQAEMSSMYGKNENISNIENNTHTQSILTTADVPNCTELEVGVIDTDSSKIEHEDYTVAYVKYTENGQTVYFDGSSWIETAPTIANLKPFTIK